MLELARDAVAAAGVEDAVLRLYWTPGAPGEGTVGIALVSVVPDWIEPARERGQRLVSLAYPRRSSPWLLPGTKSVSYATHIAAEAEAKRRGADDAVFVDLDSTVLEGPVTNIWWREGKVLRTPSLELGILAGETRAALLGVAAELGYEIETGSYPLERLLARGRGIHVVVGARGDAGPLGRRARVLPPRRRRAPAARPARARTRLSAGSEHGAPEGRRYPLSMEKLRLGGMALQNGVLVHGPTSWGAAVRLPDGSIKAASGPKPRVGTVSIPFVRGPVRLAEAFAVLPAVKRGLPEARLPFERPAVAVAVVAASAGAGFARRSSLPLASREAVAVIASVVPALVALRGDELTSYHGAEHVSIGTYETGERAAKEHERCGSHLVGPLVVATALSSVAAELVPQRHRTAARLVGALGAIGAAVEVFGWMGRNPDKRLSRALARPGTELQRRLSTSEPSDAQLEVAEAALQACLLAEGQPRDDRPVAVARGSPRSRDLRPSRSRRCATATTATRTSTTRAPRSSTTAAGRASCCRSSSASRRCSAGWTSRSRS